MRLRDQKGFTLVELMVVVAIIGMLAAVAIPNFKKYQAKSRASEAKIQLAAAYSALESFYGEYAMYHSCLDFMGYDPSGETANRHYAIGFNNELAAPGATIPGCAGAAGASNDGLSRYDAGKAFAGSPQAAAPVFTGTGNPAGHPTAGVADAEIRADLFVLGAQGGISKELGAASPAAGVTFLDDGTGQDIWAINNLKQLVQIQPGY